MLHQIHLNKVRFKAASLVETLLYISIVSMFVITLTGQSATLLQVRNRNQVLDEVNQQGVQTIMMIAQMLKDASAVTAPSAGVTAATVTVTRYTAGVSPTTIDLNAGRIRLDENGTITPITSTRVVATDLSFKNMGGLKGSIRVRFTLTHVNPDNRGELRYSQTFYDTITIR